MGNLVVRTAQQGWHEKIAAAYKARTSFELIDDAGFGIDPARDDLLAMGRKGSLGQREWLALLVSLGVGATGAWLLVMAVLDPEPYSKIAFTIGSGAFLVSSGGYSAVRILVGHKPPTITASAQGVIVSWEGIDG